MSHRALWLAPSVQDAQCNPARPCAADRQYRPEIGFDPQNDPRFLRFAALPLNKTKQNLSLAPQKLALPSRPSIRHDSPADLVRVGHSQPSPPERQRTLAIGPGDWLSLSILSKKWRFRRFVSPRSISALWVRQPFRKPRETVSDPAAPGASEW